MHRGMIDHAHTAAVHAADEPERSIAAVRTVRDAVFDVMRRLGMTTIFGNPGSTEIPFLTGLPADIHFVLGLHEGSVVGMATGYALARNEPALVNLHTAAGLGNAINAIANARDSRAPLVVLVGQQDRRQLAYEPFLVRTGARAAGRRVPRVDEPPVAAPGRPGHGGARLQRGPEPARAGARGGADGRLAGRGRRARRRMAGADGARASDLRARGGRAGGDDRARAPAGDRGRPRRRRRRRLGGGDRGRRTAVLPGVAGVVHPAGGLPAGSSAVRRPPALAARGDAPDARRPRPGGGDRDAAPSGCTCSTTTGRWSPRARGWPC